MANKDALRKYKDVRAQMLLGGGEDKLASQREKGKLTARERLDRFVDQGSFVENGGYAAIRATDFGVAEKKYLGDGVVTGSAKVDGRQVFISSQDFTVLGGSLGEMHAQKISEAQIPAMKNGTPFICINDSGGARIQEGVCP